MTARRGLGFSGLDKVDGYSDCGSPNCYHDFQHYSSLSPRFEDYIESRIFIDAVRNPGGPGTLEDKLKRSFPRARLEKAMDNLRAPICDHRMLSDEQVRNKYDPTDID